MPLNWSLLNVWPLTYQSHENSFADWVTLFTLCLAPLIAHIMSGVPQETLPPDTIPPWHERIVHYNPTSVLWRYAAIAERRIRARGWDKADMAAANTLFWTSRGWDGSEEMATTSRPHCTRLPDSNHVSIFSADMIKTIIVTLQGFQAAVLLTSPFSGRGSFHGWVGLDTMFFPLAFIGLLRLACGLWVTDDFAYAVPQHHGSNVVVPLEDTGARKPSIDSLCEAPPPTLLNTATGLVPLDGSSSRYRKPSFWPARVFRFIFLIPVLGVWTISVLYSVIAKHLSATATLDILLHAILLGSIILICGFYFVRDQTTTTIIPCISTLWYKIYTVVIGLLAVALIVVGCIETRQTMCGRWSSGPPGLADLMACSINPRGGMGATAIPVNPQNLADLHPDLNTTALRAAFGIALRQEQENGTMLDQFVVQNFTGMCFRSGEPDLNRTATWA